MEQFKIIAEYESLSKAAEVLFVSAPALSKVLHKIEAELGCELFIRSGRRIHLNSHGKKLLTYIDAIFYNCEQIDEYFSSIENAQKFVKLCNLGGNILNLLLLQFTQRYPDVSLEVETTTFKKSLDQLLNHQADVIFTDNFSIDDAKVRLKDENIVSILLFKNHLFVSALPDSDYFNDSNVSLKTLSKEKFIGISRDDPKGLAYNEYIDRICEIENAKINFVQNYSYDHFEKIVYKTPYLTFGDALHSSYYLNSWKLRSFFKLTNEATTQCIYLCYRMNGKKTPILAEYILKHFYSLFDYSKVD